MLLLFILIINIRVFVENLVRLGFFEAGSYVKLIATHEKLFAVGKSGPNATFNLVFLGLGSALGWGVRRFHHNIYFELLVPGICFPIQHNLANRKHPTITLLLILRSS